MGRSSTMSQVVQLLAAMLALGSAPVSLVAQATSACHAADRQSDDLLRYIRTVVTSNDPAFVRLRTNARIPAVDSSQVVLIHNAADSAICERARASYLRGFKTDTLHVPTVYVIRIGPTRYLVTDFKQQVGEFGAMTIFDENFSFVVGLAG